MTNPCFIDPVNPVNHKVPKMVLQTYGSLLILLFYSERYRLDIVVPIFIRKVVICWPHLCITQRKDTLYIVVLGKLHSFFNALKRSVLLPYCLSNVLFEMTSIQLCHYKKKNEWEQQPVDKFHIYECLLVRQKAYWKKLLPETIIWDYYPLQFQHSRCNLNRHYVSKFLLPVRHSKAFWYLSLLWYAYLLIG